VYVARVGERLRLMRERERDSEQMCVCVCGACRIDAAAEGKGFKVKDSGSKCGV